MCAVIAIVGAISIAEMIMINRSLQVLNISANFIGDEGITAIAKTLKIAGISVLNAQECGITAFGAKSLARGLIYNCTMKSMDVQFNDITVDGAVVILEAAVANGVCHEIKIDNDHKSDKRVGNMNSVLEGRNKQKVVMYTFVDNLRRMERGIVSSRVDLLQPL